MAKEGSYKSANICLEDPVSQVGASEGTKRQLTGEEGRGRVTNNLQQQKSEESRGKKIQVKALLGIVRIN